MTADISNALRSPSTCFTCIAPCYGAGTLNGKAANHHLTSCRYKRIDKHPASSVLFRCGGSRRRHSLKAMSAYPVYPIQLDTKHTLDVLELYGVHPGGVSAGGHIPSQALATIGTERATSNRCGLDGALHNDDALRYRACAQDDNSSPTVALDSLAVHVPDPVPPRSTVEVLRSSNNLAASVMSSWRMWVQARAHADCQAGAFESVTFHRI